MAADALRTLSRLACVAGLACLPAWTSACEATAAQLIVGGQIAQAVRLFETPAGPLDAASAERLQQRLTEVASALRLEGQPAPLIRPAPDDAALVVRIGYEPRTGDRFFAHRTVFLVDSRVAPGLRLAVLTSTDPAHCAVYAVSFEGRTGEARRALVPLRADRR